jgi:hypothetical protein
MVAINLNRRALYHGRTVTTEYTFLHDVNSLKSGDNTATAVPAVMLTATSAAAAHMRGTSFATSTHDK